MYTRHFLHLDKDEKQVSIALNVLIEASHVLISLTEGGGRHAESELGHCANFLANVFKEETGSYHWAWVGEVMAKRFPDALKVDAGGRDVALWAHNLAKRYRKLREDTIKWDRSGMRLAMERLRRRIASPQPKTIADFFPSLLKSEEYKFWPDLLTHNQKDCRICLERAKRGSNERATESAFTMEGKRTKP